MSTASDVLGCCSCLTNRGAIARAYARGSSDALGAITDTLRGLPGEDWQTLADVVDELSGVVAAELRQTLASSWGVEL